MPGCRSERRCGSGDERCEGFFQRRRQCNDRCAGQRSAWLCLRKTKTRHAGTCFVGWRGGHSAGVRTTDEARCSFGLPPRGLKILAEWATAGPSSCPGIAQAQKWIRRLSRSLGFSLPRQESRCCWKVTMYRPDWVMRLSAVPLWRTKPIRSWFAELPSGQHGRFSSADPPCSGAVSAARVSEACARTP